LRAAAKAAYGLKNSKNKNNFHLEEEIIQLVLSQCRREAIQQ
jgi:hypothetical protein